MKSVVAVTALAASIAITIPANAQSNTAAKTDAPIRIDSCTILSRSLLPDPLHSIRVQVVYGLSIGLVNIRRVTATSARVTVRYQGRSETLSERGAFATNVLVTRTFGSFSGAPAGSDSADCTLSFATLSDGTSWSVEP